MTFDWQIGVTLAAVAAAAVEVLRRVVGTFRRRRSAACGGGCGTCPGASPEGSVVELRAPPRSSR